MRESSANGDTHGLFFYPFNESTKVSASYTDNLCSDAGAVLVHALFALTGFIERLSCSISGIRREQPTA